MPAQRYKPSPRGGTPAPRKATLAAEENAIKRITFGVVAADFIARYAKPRNRNQPETERLLTKADVAPWQDRDARTIGRRVVLNVIDGVVERGAAIHANRLFAALRKMFSWAVERGILEASPMATLKPPSPEVARDRVLSDAELRAVWLAAGNMGYPFGCFVQLLILTGQRRSEVLDAEWREFAVSKREWTIPRQREKNDRAHVVPLSQGALAILKRISRIDPSSRFPFFSTTGDTPFSGVSKSL